MRDLPSKPEQDCAGRDDQAGENTPGAQSFAKKHPANHNSEDDTRFPQRRDRAGWPEGERRDNDAIGDHRDQTTVKGLPSVACVKIDHESPTQGKERGRQEYPVQHKHPGRLRGKTGWREVEVGRGSADATCPVAAIETWVKFAKLAHGPLFRRVTGQGKAVGSERLNDKEVALLVKRAAMAAGVRGDLSEIERALKFSGHSLRAGLASSAEVDERYVQKQLGHASAEMTRRYQRRRDRFRVNLTKASGL